ncbi:MAG: hypothetical protein K2Y32_05495 [Candidatus Obscuribacterales bacterium]|nr:hypothetical protein [Candidatus Obscuribacterales bacterium]
MAMKYLRFLTILSAILISAGYLFCAQVYAQDSAQKRAINKVGIELSDLASGPGGAGNNDKVSLLQLRPSLYQLKIEHVRGIGSATLTVPESLAKVEICLRFADFASLENLTLTGPVYRMHTSSRRHPWLLLEKRIEGESEAQEKFQATSKRLKLWLAFENKDIVVKVPALILEKSDSSGIGHRKDKQHKKEASIKISWIDAYR